MGPAHHNGPAQDRLTTEQTPLRTWHSLIPRASLIISLSASLYGQLPSTGDPPTAPKLRTSLPKGMRANPLAPSPLAPPPLGPASRYDTSTREAVRDTWNLTFWPTINVATGWTGDVDANIPGTTTQLFKDAVAARINWFRAMAGVPPQITISPVYSAKDQKAALMFSANRQISHYPPSSWVDYSAEGAEAAANSNICDGYFNDPGCVAAYINDWGSNNAAAGHRRWILYPQTLVMGTGDVPQSGPAANPYPPANALWVFDGMYGTARPATRASFVAWPPPGYVPYQVVAQRWSFSYAGADFTNVSVSMQRNGAAVPVRLEPVLSGYGENTIVWVPDNLDASSYYQPSAPSADTMSNITLANVLIAGVPQTFSYSVTVFDPDTAPGSSFEFLPTSASIGSGTSFGAASLVVTPSSTTWTAASSANWLSLNSASSGTGSTSIAWSATANSSSYQRTAAIRGGTATFTVGQDGAPCSYAFSGDAGTLPAAGGSGSFTVTSTPSDCPFGSYSWSGTITVTSSWAATGVLTLTYSAGANGTGLPRLSTIQVAGSSFSVTQSAEQQTGITIQTNPSGLQFTVDGGAAQTAPQTLNLPQGSHTLAVATTQAGPTGTQYLFTGWSDSGAASHSIAVGASAATYTATFKTQFQLTISASPTAGGTVTPASRGFYDSGTAVPIGATANGGYIFMGWSGAVGAPGAASTTVTMSAPQTVTANFNTVTSHPAFFTGEVALANSVYSLQLADGNPFGYYGYLASSWIYHFDLGYEYTAPGNGPEVYIWDMASGHWWYTNSSQFPYLYDFTLHAWLFYFPDTHNAGHYTTNPRYFANMTTNQVFTM